MLKALNYRQPPPPPRPQWRRVAAGVVLAAAVLVAVAAELTPDAPLRQTRENVASARQARGRATITNPVVELAAGRNIALHFDDSAPSPASGRVAADLYFGLSYDLFPARAFVGDDTRVINDDVTLRAADRTPSDAWLRAHAAAAVVTFPFDAAGLHRPTARPVR